MTALLILGLLWLVAGLRPGLCVFEFWGWALLAVGTIALGLEVVGAFAGVPAVLFALAAAAFFISRDHNCYGAV